MNKLSYINKENINEMGIVLTLGDFYFYRLLVRFRGEKKFREVFRSIGADSCIEMMEDLK